VLFWCGILHCYGLDKHPSVFTSLFGGSLCVEIEVATAVSSSLGKSFTSDLQDRKTITSSESTTQNETLKIKSDLHYNSVQVWSKNAANSDWDYLKENINHQPILHAFNLSQFLITVHRVNNFRLSRAFVRKFVVQSCGSNEH
jgi:hypothetical protein